MICSLRTCLRAKEARVKVRLAKAKRAVLGVTTTWAVRSRFPFNLLARNPSDNRTKCV
jgi:hypothetical protein